MIVLLCTPPFSDRIRTSINIIGDSYGAGIVYHLSRQTLAEQDRLKAEQEKAKEGEEDIEIDMSAANDRESARVMN